MAIPFRSDNTTGLRSRLGQAAFHHGPGVCQSVRRAFKELFDRGLIYKGHYMINWCPRCGTAISDLEVTYEEEDSHLWFIRYSFEDQKAS